MSAVLLEAPAASSTQRAEALAAELRQRFEAYNAEFTRITRRAAEHFHSRNWQAARADAVQRIELYDRHVGAAMFRFPQSSWVIGRDPRRRRLMQCW